VKLVNESWCSNLAKKTHQWRCFDRIYGRVRHETYISSRRFKNIDHKLMKRSKELIKTWREESEA
jgi:hypothetical protein